MIDYVSESLQNHVQNKWGNPRKYADRKPLPCYANQTETKRYSKKLVSTYQSMSAGEEWPVQREISFGRAKDQRIYQTEVGQKGE